LLSLDEARRMTADALTDRLLGPAGAQMREVEIYDGAGAFDGRSSLAEVAFASLPRSAGFAGVCEAGTINVVFENTSRERSVSTPSRVKTVYTSTRFAILPDYSPDTSGTEDWRGQERACKKLGPVLTRWDPPMRRGFFSGWADERRSLRAVDLHFAARALIAARGAVAQGKLTVACGGDASDPADELCRNASASFASLPWQAVVFVQLSWCDDSRATRCAEFHFARSGSDKFRDRRIAVRISTDTAKIDPPSKSISVSAVSMTGETLAD
jgi:hypothetical protein